MDIILYIAVGLSIVGLGLAWHTINSILKIINIQSELLEDLQNDLQKRYNENYQMV